MPGNYVLLETIQLTQSAASVTFDNIPQTGYSDLKVFVSARSDAAFTRRILRLRFNNSSTASDYTARDIVGSGSAASSGLQTAGTSTYIQVYDLPAANATANIFGNIMIDVLNYANTSTYKSISVDSVSEDNATTAYMSLLAGLYNQNTAISQINLSPDSGNFVANSTFSLYGVAAVGSVPAISPYASGGDMVSTDGTYWTHTFLTSGSFTPSKSLSCNYLVVAGGGGGGGGYYSGGGGAGGLRSTVTSTGGGGTLESAINVTSQKYTITVGAGGVGGAIVEVGGNGNNSIFSTITAIGGGGGGKFGGADGVAGGSGGGGSNNGSSRGAGGAGTANQGYAGGNGSPNGGEYNSGGGGGGAGAAGQQSQQSVSNPWSGTGGAGGNGVSVAITGSSVAYAGGGGGGQGNPSGTQGAGGSGGGGAGGKSGGLAATAGTTNLGSGGGGAGGYPQVGAAGGSGIVIIRYAV